MQARDYYQDVYLTVLLMGKSPRVREWGFKFWWLKTRIWPSKKTTHSDVTVKIMVEWQKEQRKISQRTFYRYLWSLRMTSFLYLSWPLVEVSWQTSSSPLSPFQDFWLALCQTLVLITVDIKKLSLTNLFLGYKYLDDNLP